MQASILAEMKNLRKDIIERFEELEDKVDQVRVFTFSNKKIWS